MARSGDPSSGPSRLRVVAWSVYSRVYAVVAALATRVVSALGVLRSSEGRTAVLILVAYVAGIAGLGLTFFGDPTAAETDFGAVGIGLMGLTFICLFVVSVSVLNATGGHVEERSSHRR